MAGRDRHCRRRGCVCAHAACDRGWIDDDERGTGTRPCLTCREELAAAVLPARSRDELRWALARHRGSPIPTV